MGTADCVFLRLTACCLQSIRVARDAICSLILGSPPGKVYSKLRSVCTRLNEGV